MLKWLQDWFSDLCDGEWEHENSIIIESIDNPGWSIQIELSSNKIILIDKEWKTYELTENNWIGFKIVNNVFFAAGDPLKLEELIFIFKKIIENNIISDELVFNLLKNNKY